MTTRHAVKVRDWAESDDDYDPPHTVGVLGRADAEVLRDAITIWSGVRRPARRCIDFDDSGRPLNPTGRTGLAGHGTLPAYGENVCEEVLLVEADDRRGCARLVARRDACGGLALPDALIPGAPVDPLSECVLRQAFHPDDWHLLCDARLRAAEVALGYAADERSTDHAWVSRRTFLVELFAARAARLVAPYEWVPMEHGIVEMLPPTTAAVARRWKAVREKALRGRRVRRRALSVAGVALALVAWRVAS